MRYTGEHFRDQRVELDGNAFEQCRFTNVLFVYAGGPVTLDGCTFDGIGWQMAGNLGRGLAMLGALYASKQSAGLSLVASSMFPKSAEPAGPAPLDPTLIALFEAEARDDEEADAAASAQAVDYGRLHAAIRRAPSLGATRGHC